MGIYKRGDTWWLDYSDHRKRRRRVSLRCRSQVVAERAARQILELEEQRRAGVLTPGEEAAAVPLAEHLAAFRVSLRVSPQQEHQVMRTLTRATKGATRLAEFTLEAADRWLARERARGISSTTLNHSRSHLIRFARWLYATDRTAVDPLKGLGRFKAPREGEEDGGRFERLALTDEELVALLATTPEPRRTVYLLAATTGLRRGELAALRWSSVDLEGRQLTVRAGTAKSRRTAHLPLVPAAADALQALRDRSWARAELLRLQELRARSSSEEAAAQAEGIARSALRRRVDRLGTLLELPDELVVFPGGRWAYPEGRGPGVPTVDRLRSDAAKAGVETETPEGLLDFHALRTTFGTALARAGVPLVVAQRLMRHSTPDLTSRYYTRVRSQDQRSAVAALWAGLERVPSLGDPLTFPGPDCGRNCDATGGSVTDSVSVRITANNGNQGTGGAATA